MAKARKMLSDWDASYIQALVKLIETQSKSMGRKIDGRHAGMPKKHKMSDYWNMGTTIGFGAAIGIVLGALLNNLILWMGIGAGLGVVIGAISQMYKNKE